MTMEERFWGKVHKRGFDECWPWLGYTRRGYGRMYVRGRQEQAHRIAWEIINGAIPQGALVCHRCDNPQCCNPAHLFLGTVADNAHDRDEKGRAANTQGEKSAQAKLSRADVLAIRECCRRSDCPSQVALAAEFGVVQQTVSKIVCGETWKHLSAVKRVREKG